MDLILAGPVKAVNYNSKTGLCTLFWNGIFNGKKWSYGGHDPDQHCGPFHPLLGLDQRDVGDYDQAIFFVKGKLMGKSLFIQAFVSTQTCIMSCIADPKCNFISYSQKPLIYTPACYGFEKSNEVNTNPEYLNFITMVIKGLSKLGFFFFCIRLQSNLYKMFTAYFKPSWPSRPKTNVTLLFYFLKLYNFGFLWIFYGINQFWATVPTLISNITNEPKQSIFRLLKFFQSIDFYEISHGHCNLLEFQIVNSLKFCMSIAWAWKLSLVLCNGGQKWPFLQFFSSSWKID